MKKIIFTAFIIGIIALSWQPHCDHVFVAVENPEIKVHPMPTMTYAIPNATIGNAQGKDIICIKCFHRQHQVINYGSVDDWDMPRMPSMSPNLNVPEYFQQKAKEARELTNRQLIDSFIKCPEPPSDWLIDSAGNLIKVPRTCW